MAKSFSGRRMVIGKVLQAVLKIAALSTVAVLIVSATQFIWAYLAAPNIVAHFERSAKLPLDPASLSQTRRDWLLAVDDPTFYQHHGIDSRTRGAGYTTITQGLVKVLFFDDFQPGLFRWRKVKQTIIAIAFNSRVSKDEQLRLFVNAVYLGNRDGHEVRGFSSASEEYIGKPFTQISDEEYLQLVAMIVAPDKYNLATHPDRNRDRVQRIRRLLAGECTPGGVNDVEYADCGHR
jgi:membrane carboxypeptidase/penicillin-binding protein